MNEVDIATTQGECFSQALKDCNRSRLCENTCNGLTTENLRNVLFVVRSSAPDRPLWPLIACHDGQPTTHYRRSEMSMEAMAIQVSKTNRHQCIARVFRSRAAKVSETVRVP
jgi:hypothetical protein